MESTEEQKGKISKRQRFITFIEKSLVTTEPVLFANAQHSITQNEHLTLKFVIKDIKYLRYMTIDHSEAKLVRTNDHKIDAYMIFDTAKTLHMILIGKLLPLNLSLIGKVTILYKSKKARVFSSIYMPARNNYKSITKGTRFTMKSHPDTLQPSLEQE